jgi:hypothetical protein
MRTAHAKAKTTEGAIWVRLIGNTNLSRAKARGLLSIGFSEADRSRMRELAEKNNEGTISHAELEELDSYVKVGDVLSLLHLKAKKGLKN